MSPAAHILECGADDCAACADCPAGPCPTACGCDSCRAAAADLPTAAELDEWADRAAEAADELHHIIRAMWWHKMGPLAITGPPRERMNRAYGAERAYADLRRLWWPTAAELATWTEARRAWEDLQKVGIDPAPWDYMGRYQTDAGTMWTFAHRDRREPTFTGRRSLRLLAL